MSQYLRRTARAQPRGGPLPQWSPKTQSGQARPSFPSAARTETYHQQTTDIRNDILVYTSEPFKEAYTFAGPLSAVLYAASSGRDTDWFMRLMEVDKAGKIFQLAEGKIRARFRHSTKQPELLEANKVYEYQLDLWQMGISIPAGHRLRVEVAPASFPSYSRNLNTGGHN
jgi:putative CocE/NonD family hydrolase